MFFHHQAGPTPPEAASKKALPPELSPHFGVLLKTEQAADYLAISQRTLWAITSPRGPLRAVRIRNAVRYDVRDLHAYIDQAKDGGVA
jgi:hypothetical protein